MRWQHYLAYFFGGAFLANAVPHLGNGISGRAFQSPFASPPVLAENPSEPKSCGLADVAMVQATDLRQFDDPPQPGWVDGPGLG